MGTIFKLLGYIGVIAGAAMILTGVGIVPGLIVAGIGAVFFGVGTANDIKEIETQTQKEAKATTKNANSNVILRQKSTEFAKLQANYTSTSTKSNAPTANSSIVTPALVGKPSASNGLSASTLGYRRKSL